MSTEVRDWYGSRQADWVSQKPLRGKPRDRWLRASSLQIKGDCEAAPGPIRRSTHGFALLSASVLSPFSNLSSWGTSPSDANYRERTHGYYCMLCCLLAPQATRVRSGMRMRLFSLRFLVRSRLQPRAYDSKTGSKQSRYECATRRVANPAPSVCPKYGPQDTGAGEQAPVWASSGRKAPGLGKVPCSASLASAGKEGNSAAVGIDTASFAGRFG